MAVTIDEVRKIYPRAVAMADADVQYFLDTTSDIINELLVDCGYSSTMLDAIIKYATAHYISVSQESGGLASKTTGSSSETYRDLPNDAYGLGSTLFGQQALALDIGGCLTKISSSPIRAIFRVV